MSCPNRYECHVQISIWGETSIFFQDQTFENCLKEEKLCGLKGVHFEFDLLFYYAPAKILHVLHTLVDAEKDIEK